jgi:microcystin-dependent protein
MTTTPNLGLTLPTVGASRDTWGALLNTNFTTLDTAVSAAMPIGSVIDFAGPTAPSGWLVCGGQNVSRTTYSDLFSAIGIAWGPGDGSTTFRLPNTPGRASVAAGTVTDSNGNHVVFSLGQTTGAVLQTIQQTHLPSYNLTVSTTGAHTHGGLTGGAGAHSHSVAVPNASPVAAVTPGDLGGIWSTNAGMTTVATSGQDQHVHTVASDGNHTHTVALGGGGTALPVLSPVIVFTKIIYAGAQAVTRALGKEGRELSAPLRGSH